MSKNKHFEFHQEDFSVNPLNFLLLVDLHDCRSKFWQLFWSFLLTCTCLLVFKLASFEWLRGRSCSSKLKRQNGVKDLRPRCIWHLPCWCAYLLQVVLQAFDVQTTSFQVAVSGDGDHSQQRRCTKIEPLELRTAAFMMEEGKMRSKEAEIPTFHIFFFIIKASTQVPELLWLKSRSDSFINFSAFLRFESL